jgi:ABC-type lipoprotein release transport system permease subunit
MLMYLRLAWRNIWRHKRRTWIIVASIGFTLALMIFYDGLIAGFQQAIYGNAIKVLGGNIQIHAAGYAEAAGQTPLIPLVGDEDLLGAVEQTRRVVAASRRIVSGGLISNHTGALGVNIVGIEPEREKSVSLIANNISAGAYLRAADGDVILIGKGMADEMELQVGDRVTLAGRARNEKSVRRTMTVGGIYDIGMADLEKTTVYLSLGGAQSLLGLEGQATEIMLVLERVGQEKEVMAGLLKVVGNGNEISTWQSNFPELEAAITTKSGVMNVFGVIILVIAGVGILNQLLMAIIERTREIGVLSALGMKPRQISLLFLLEGVMIGLVGLVTGVLIGLAINISFAQVGLDYTQFSSLSSYMALISERIYPSPGLEKLGLRGTTVVVVSIIAALIPAWEASLNEPAKSLHYV